MKEGEILCSLNSYKRYDSAMKARDKVRKDAISALVSAKEKPLMRDAEITSARRLLTVSF